MSTDIDAATPQTTQRRKRPRLGAGPWITLARAMWLSFVRDKSAIFFYFLFPLMFLVLFGLLLANVDQPTFRLGVVGDGPLIEALPEELFDIEEIDSFDHGVEQVANGDIPGVVRQSGTSLEFRYSAAEQSSAQTLNMILSSFVDQANMMAIDAEPVFTLESSQVEDDSFKPIQYITSGILSWAVAMSAAFGAALNLVSWRKTQVLRRLRLSPASPLAVVGARVGVSLAIAMIQAAVFIGLATTGPFGLQVSWSALWVIPILICGTLAFTSIGLFVGAVTKTEEAASGAVNLLILPMAFISGVFVAPELLPGWIQAISWALPLKHIASALLDVLVRTPEIGSTLMSCGVLLAFALILGGLAGKFFSWDD